MKNAIIIVTCSLLLTSSLSAMQDNSITIHNITDKTIGVNFEYVDKNTGENKGCHINGSENDIKPNTTSVISLDLSTHPYLKKVPTLVLPDATPTYIQLNISEKGYIQPGDSLTICKKENAIFVEKEGYQAKCSFITQPLTIGSNPAGFPQNIPNQQKTLTISNKDLFQVTIILQALCCPSSQKSLNNLSSYSLNNDPFYIRGDHLKASVKKNDSVLEKRSINLKTGKKKTIKTFTEKKHPGVLDTLIKLFIPQAKIQEVHVLLNDGEIKSGDTLDISLSPEDNKILITNGLKVLARLYSHNIIYDKTTIG